MLLAIVVLDTTAGDDVTIVMFAAVPVYFGRVVDVMLTVLELEILAIGGREFVVEILGAGCKVKPRPVTAVSVLL